MSSTGNNRPPRFIYFAGVDGSGKSTVINELIKEYNRKGLKAKSVWLRFNYFFTRPVLLLCRLLGITRREKRGDKIISVHDFHKSRAMAFMVQYLHFIDTAIAFFVKVWIPLRFTNCIILCDKFIYDILADFIVETKDFDIPSKRIAKLFLKLIPEGTPVFYFIVEKEEILRRKPEVLIDDEDFDLKYKAYQTLMDKCNVIIIKNDTMNETILKVSSTIGIDDTVN
jgi:thymidylate kinase